MIYYFAFVLLHFKATWLIKAVLTAEPQNSMPVLGERRTTGSQLKTVCSFLLTSNSPVAASEPLCFWGCT